MDSQILAAERADLARRRKTAMTIYFVAVGVLLFFVFGLVGTVLGATVGFRFGIGIAAGALAVTVALLAMILGIVKATSTGTGAGAASKGPASWGQIYTQAPPDEVWAAINRSVAAQAMTARQIGPGTIRAEKSMNFWSWGSSYLIDVRASVDRPGMAVVSIQAEPKVSFTMADYGIAQNTNNAILAAIPGQPAIGYGQLPSIGPGQAPHMPYVQRSPQDRHHSG